MAGAQVTALKTKIQTVADATTEPFTQVGLGDPAGADVSTSLGDKSRGQGWVAEAVVDTMFEGTGQYLEANIISKINELIGEYNQLRADIITASIATTANAVATITT